MSRYCKRYNRCKLPHLGKLIVSTATFAILTYGIAILLFTSFYFPNPTTDASLENLQQAKKPETVETVSEYRYKVITDYGIVAGFLDDKPEPKKVLPHRFDRPQIMETSHGKSQVVSAYKTDTKSGTKTKKWKTGRQKHPDRLSKDPTTTGTHRKWSVTGLDDLLRLPRHDPSSSDPPINPHNFRYVLNPVDLCTRGREPFLLAYVHTAPFHFRQRMAIRRTWGNGSHYDVSFRLVFFLGKPLQESEQERVFTEANRYGDIVQEDFIDSYSNLTHKAVGALKWVTGHCLRATYVLKADDDIFINMFALLAILKQRRNLLDNNSPTSLPSQPSNLRPGNASSDFKKSPLLQKNSPTSKNSLNNVLDLADGPKNSSNLSKNAFDRPKSTILCAIQESQPVMRWGKWRVARDYWKDDIYPPFCAGAAYVMTSDVIVALYRESLSVPNYVIDDVYVTGFLVMRLSHVTRVQLSTFYAIFGVKPIYDVTESEWREKFIFYHSKSHDEYSATWRRLVTIYHR